MMPFKAWLEKQPLYLKARYWSPVLRAWLWLRKDVQTELGRQKMLYASCITQTHSKLIFDIGANEGFLSQLFLDLGFSVVAAEPAPRNIAILKARFERSKNVNIVEKAVSDQIGLEPFFEVMGEHAYGTSNNKWAAEIRSSLQNHNRGTIQQQTIVPATTLDALITQYGIPDFIKIDVEGGEQNVLRGLNTKVPMLSFEAILPLFLFEAIDNIEYLSVLDQEASFNFSVNNSLASEHFIKKEKLIEMLHGLPAQTIEVFCKMHC